MSQRVSTIRSYSFSFLALPPPPPPPPPSVRETHRGDTDPPSSHTYQWRPSCCQTHSHAGRVRAGRPGQGSEVALQRAIFLSLPNACECMGGKKSTLRPVLVAETERFRPTHSS